MTPWMRNRLLVGAPLLLVTALVAWSLAAGRERSWGRIVVRPQRPVMAKFDQLGQCFGVKSGVVSPRACEDLRVEPIVTHVLGPADG